MSTGQLCPWCETIKGESIQEDPSNLVELCVSCFYDLNGLD